MSRESGYSLLEIIIVIGIVALIVVSYPLTINFRLQADKTNDTRRKSDLALMKRLLEDFYNDNNRYPLPGEICYNGDSSSTTCNICGKEDAPAEITSYTKNLICDPQFPRRDYVYEVDDANNPTWYIIYANLANVEDPYITSVGCSNGCGPGSAYNYGVSSDNVNVSTGAEPPVYCNSAPGNLFSNDGGICNICGTYDECVDSHGLGTFYYDGACSLVCINP